MTLVKSPETAKMLRGTEDMNCSECGKACTALIQYTTKSADMFMCENCAQVMMRILFQELIYLQNGQWVSLTGIMHHGRKAADRTTLPKDCHPNGMKRQQRGLFDF